MAHVAPGSSANGSSQVYDVPAVFDLTKETDVLALLRTIHRSTLKQQVKNDLRDVLFELKYATDEDHTAVISALAEAGFAATYDSPVANIVPPTSSTQKFGRARLVPRFAPVVPKEVTAPAPVAEPAVPPEPIKITEETSVVSEAKPAPAASPVEPVVGPVTPAPVTEPPAASAQPAAAPAASSTSDPMTRIKEIKRLVTEKIGNPITLLDANNQVGREYMNALLAAMKTLNGGRPEEVTAAMSRLEKAFEAAVEVVKNAPPRETATDKFVSATTGNQSTAGPVSGFEMQKDQPAAPVQTAPVTPPPMPTPAAPVASALDKDSVSIPAEQSSIDTPSSRTQSDQSPLGAPVKIRVNSASLGITAEPENEPSLSESPQSVPVVNKMAPVSGTAPSMAAPVAPDIAPVAPITPEATPVATAPMTRSAAAMTPPKTDAGAAVAGQGARLMSVAKEEQLQSLMRQNQVQAVADAKQQDAQMRATGDPLQMPEVTAGLKQLLSEWSLFKSSGFFGTGPGGVDHPLYKQMSTLTMAAVIAGRFEGATPQVKQSITDYMNGWRYEEGIVHEHTETFEHYLRRVIKHILDNKDK